jgi:hypothetical protein
MSEKNIFQKIGDAVVDYAPGIAGVLALVPGVGTVPAAALGAVAALGRSFGLGSTAQPEDVLATISVDPEIRLKAIVANNEFLLKQREQDIEELKTYLADIQSARNMAVEGIKATGKRDYEDKVFDWFIILGFVICLIALFYFTPAESTYMGMMIGALIAAFTTVVNFRKGSSKSSEVKTDMIYKSTPIK